MASTLGCLLLAGHRCQSLPHENAYRCSRQPVTSLHLSDQLAPPDTSMLAIGGVMLGLTSSVRTLISEQCT